MDVESTKWKLKSEKKVKEQKGIPIELVRVYLSSLNCLTNYLHAI